MFALRLGLALILGVIMGLERQLHQKMAGMRTNALVSCAAAAFSMIGLMDSGMGNVSRIVGQIISGVGFLGAGVIFKEGMNVHGLNTAATVWCSAAVGALAGFGYPQYAIITTVAVILTNLGLRPLAARLQPAIVGTEVNYHVELTCAAQEETQIRALLLNSVDRNHLTLTALQSEDGASAGRVKVSAAIHAKTRNDTCLEELVARITLEPNVYSVSWRLELPTVVE